MEDNESDSYDEIKIQNLKKQLQVSKSELLQLAYNQETLNDKIDQLNSQGCHCIGQQLYYEAMAYLEQAEQILEYAAGCGRTIDRALIIATLHNQATAYQRLWELSRSADYIEAIIYNITSFLTNEAQISFSPDIKDPRSPQHIKLAIYLGSKINLITYLLQFCAVSSQIKNHSNALGSAQKALIYLKIYCQELYAYEKMAGGPVCSDFQKSLLCQLHNIKDFQNEDVGELSSYVEKLLNKAHKSILIFQKKLECTPAGISKLQLKQLQTFSLGQLMQVSPLLLKSVQERLDLQLELTLVKKIYKAIYISITHFTMATELRLIANERYGIDSCFRSQSKQFLQSQVHHLVAIITVALYVPCYTKYFEHILKSFMNHYQIDLTKAHSFSEDSEQLNGDLIHLEIQSIELKDSEMSKPQQDSNSKSNSGTTSKENRTRRTDKSSLLNTTDRPTNKTTNQFGSNSSSQNQNLRSINKTNINDKNKKGSKKSLHKSKKKSEHTERQKRIIIVEKVTSKSRSKGKKETSHRRSKSGKKDQEEEEEEKVVHYFQYDNYSSKKVVKKGKHQKEPSDLLKRAAKGIRDKKSPEGMINTHLKRLKAISQSNKDLITSQARTIKKAKSPEMSASRSPNFQPKKHK